MGIKRKNKELQMEQGRKSEADTHGSGSREGVRQTQQSSRREEGATKLPSIT